MWDMSPEPPALMSSSPDTLCGPVKVWQSRSEWKGSPSGGSDGVWHVGDEARLGATGVVAVPAGGAPASPPQSAIPWRGRR